MGLMALRSSKTAPVVSSLVTTAYIIIATAALEIVTAAAAAGVKLAQVLGDVALDPFVHVLHPGYREGVFNSLLPRIDFSNLECDNTYFWDSWE